MRIQWMLATRYLRGRLQRSILTTLAIVFGVTILFGMNALIPPVYESFRHSIYTSAEVVDFTFSSVSNSTFDETNLQKLINSEGVALASATLQRSVLLPSVLSGSTSIKNNSLTITLTGLNPENAQRTHVYSMESGRFLNVEDTSAVVIPLALASQLNLEVGSIFSIPSATGKADLTVVGIMNNTISASGNYEVIVPLSAAQSILNLPGQINSIDVILASSANRDAMQQTLLQELGSSFKVGPVTVGDEFEAGLKMGYAVMWFFGIAALAMAAFIIFNTFRTLVAERRRDLAMLRAIGATRHTLMGMILAESLVQGIIGTAIGLILGALMATGMLNGFRLVIQQYIHVEIGQPIFTLANWIGSISLGIGFTLCSAFFPARSAMQVTPLEAMRPSLGVVEHRRIRISGWIGLALCLISVVGLLVGDLNITALSMLAFLIGLILATTAIVKPVAIIFSALFGFMFKRVNFLARENLIRQPGRAAITASAMMIGLAITIALTGMVTSVWSGFMGYLDKSLGSDYILMPESLVLGAGNLGAAPELASNLRNIDGVKEVTTLRLATAQINGTSLQVIGIDPQTYPQVAGLEFSSGDAQQAYTTMANERAMIVNAVFAISSGVKTGDRVTLKTPQGDQIYKIVGIASDYLNAKLETGYIPQKYLAADFNSTSDVLIMIDRSAQSNASQVSLALQKAIDAYPAFTLFDATAFKQSQEQLFTGAISALYLLVVMLALPGLIAMANTMSINVIERTREIGMLRAVGSTRLQIRRLITAESLLLSMLGALLGIMVGLCMGYSLVKCLTFFGFKLDFFFPSTGILVAIIVSLGFGLLAALAPAQKAARSQIVEALRYE